MYIAQSVYALSLCRALQPPRNSATCNQNKKGLGRNFAAYQCRLLLFVFLWRPPARSFWQPWVDRNQNNIHASLTNNLTTRYGWGGGGYVCPHPLTFFASSFLIDFLELVGNLPPIHGKISNLLFRLKFSPKHFFCPTTTYSALYSSDHPCMKICFW